MFSLNVESDTFSMLSCTTSEQHTATDVASNVRARRNIYTRIERAVEEKEHGQTDDLSFRTDADAVAARMRARSCRRSVFCAATIERDDWGRQCVPSTAASGASVTLCPHLSGVSVRNVGRDKPHIPMMTNVLSVR